MISKKVTFLLFLIQLIAAIGGFILKKYDERDKNKK